MLSATDVANFLACHHILTLERAQAAGGIRKPFFHDPGIELLRGLGAKHEQAYSRHLTDNQGLEICEIQSNVPAAEAVAQTLDALRWGVSVVYQATFQGGPWYGRSDFLVRVQKPSALGSWSYEVVEMKLAPSTKAGALIQLCFYSDLLSQIQHVQPEWMHVVLGGRTNPEKYPVELVVASAASAEGEEVYPRRWNHNFVGMPIVDPTKQHHPTVTQAELQAILTAIIPRYRILVALLAGTGLRIGEALGLKTGDLTEECGVLHVQRSIWLGKEQAPKIANAVRVIDIPECLAHVLREHVTGKSGYLFPTRTGTPLSSRNVLRALYNAGATCGFHSFRRYRAAVLRKARVPEDRIGLWLGHARGLTDRYATQLREDVAYRAEWCERAGLGFQLVHDGTQNVIGIDAAKVA